MAMKERIETIDKLTTALLAAQERYDDAEKLERQAYKDKTRALNELIEAQKQFDAFVIELKKNAPDGSNWPRLAQRDNTV